MKKNGDLLVATDRHNMQGIIGRDSDFDQPAFNLCRDCGYN